jgi:hypothetical protein
MPSDMGQLKLRLPQTLRKRLERASDKSGRSLNNEIVWRLTQTFGDEGAALFEQHQQAEQTLRDQIEQVVKKVLDERMKGD